MTSRAALERAFLEAVRTLASRLDSFAGFDIDQRLALRSAFVRADALLAAPEPEGEREFVIPPEWPEASVEAAARYLYSVEPDKPPKGHPMFAEWEDGSDTMREIFRGRARGALDAARRAQSDARPIPPAEPEGERAEGRRPSDSQSAMTSAGQPGMPSPGQSEAASPTPTPPAEPDAELRKLLFKFWNSGLEWVDATEDAIHARVRELVAEGVARGREEALQGLPPRQPVLATGWLRYMPHNRIVEVSRVHLSDRDWFTGVDGVPVEIVRAPKGESE